MWALNKNNCVKAVKLNWYSLCNICICMLLCLSQWICKSPTESVSKTKQTFHRINLKAQIYHIYFKCKCKLSTRKPFVIRQSSVARKIQFTITIQLTAQNILSALDVIIRETTWSGRSYNRQMQRKCTHELWKDFLFLEWFIISTVFEAKLHWLWASALRVCRRCA